MTSRTLNKLGSVNGLLFQGMDWIHRSPGRGGERGNLCETERHLCKGFLPIAAAFRRHVRCGPMALSAATAAIDSSVVSSADLPKMRGGVDKGRILAATLDNEPYRLRTAESSTTARTSQSELGRHILDSPSPPVRPWRRTSESCPVHRVRPAKPSLTSDTRLAALPLEPTHDAV
jgi:hypothetical protein